MTYCKFLKHIADYVLGEYEGDAIQLQEHITSCKQCAAEFEKLSRLLGLMRDAAKYRMEAVPPPHSGFSTLREEVLLRIRYFREILGDQRIALKFRPPIIVDHKKRRTQVDDIVDVLTWKDSRNVIIMGPPGSGKKTTLNWVFAEILERNGFPVYIRNENVFIANAIREKRGGSRALREASTFPILKRAAYEYRSLQKKSKPIFLVPDVDRVPIPMVNSFLEKSLFFGFRVILTGCPGPLTREVIDPSFFREFVPYHIDGIDSDYAWEIIDELSGKRNSRANFDVRFTDNKWTLGRAKFIARLVKSEALSQVKQPIERDEDLCYHVLESMFKDYKLDCDFAFAFLERIACTVYLGREQFLTRKHILNELSRLEMRQGKRVDRETFLSRLCQMGILQSHTMEIDKDLATLYSFSELFPYCYYFFERACANSLDRKSREQRGA